MSSPKTDTPEFGDELPRAAEFVLGLVRGEERDALEKRRRDDYRFASEVEFWEARLGPLADKVVPEDVPAHVWEQIVRKIGHAPAPFDAQPAGRAARGGVWHSLRVWRTLGIASSALAAACLVFLFTTPASPPPSLVAALTLSDGQSAFMATVDRMTGRVMLMPAADMPAPPDRTYELWIVPPDGKAVSLGTLSINGMVSIDMPSAVMPHAAPHSALVVSVEPMGGSPTGEPTGPVVAKGMMRDI